jgi:hypothetical protein
MDLRIWAASRQRGVCRSCGHKIEWATVVDTGRKIPLDAPVEVRDVSGADDGRLIEHIDTTRSKSHFATCPDAAEWRRRRTATRTP